MVGEPDFYALRAKSKAKPTGRFLRYTAEFGRRNKAIKSEARRPSLCATACKLGDGTPKTKKGLHCAGLFASALRTESKADLH